MALDHPIDFRAGLVQRQRPLGPAQFLCQSVPVLPCHNFERLSTRVPKTRLAADAAWTGTIGRADTLFAHEDASGRATAGSAARWGVNQWDVGAATWQRVLPGTGETGPERATACLRLFDRDGPDPWLLTGRRRAR